MEVQVRSLPKRGGTIEESQDAADADLRTARFAIADGASEGYPSGPWARMLVENFVRNPSCRPADWLSRLPALQQQWSERFAGQALPWYGEDQRAQGAFSTFLGVTIETNESSVLSWSAVAVGDTCLFHVRNDSLQLAFPVTRSADFCTSPRLVGSRTSLGTLESRQVFACGEFAFGDQLWLATDALAQWFLGQHESSGKPWEHLEPLVSASASSGDFARMIERLRDERRIRNDDVTLVSIDLMDL